MPAYNCNNCPGYCCSYPLIQLTQRYVEHLAKHHGLTFDEEQAKFTKAANGAKYAIRQGMPFLRYRGTPLHDL